MIGGISSKCHAMTYLIESELVFIQSFLEESLSSERLMSHLSSYSIHLTEAAATSVKFTPDMAGSGGRRIANV